MGHIEDFCNPCAKINDGAHVGVIGGFALKSLKKNRAKRRMTAWGRVGNVKFMAVGGGVDGKTVGTSRIPHRGRGFREVDVRVYRFMAMVSPSMVSTVVTIFELAW